MSSEKYVIAGDLLKVSENKRKNVCFEDALEETGFGKYNVLFTIVCGISLFAANIESYSVGYVLPSAECDLKLDLSSKSILTSTSFVGYILTCCIWGFISDRIGRRKILVTCLVLSFITGSAAALTPSFWDFTILRFLNGVFISGPSAIIFAYFGEFQSNTHKSKAMAIMSIFVSLALIAMPGLGWLLLPRKIIFDLLGLKITSWRIFMLINSAPNIIAAIGIFMCPESPKYLYHNGKTQTALEVLKQVYSLNTNRSKNSFPVESLEEEKSLDELNIKSDGMLKELSYQIGALFKKPIWKYVLAGCYMQAGVFAISSGLFLWYPDIINQLANAEGNISMTVCDALSKSGTGKVEEVSLCTENLDSNMFIQNLIIGLAYGVGYSAWGVVVNLLGNRNVFITCMMISSIGTVVLCFVTQKLLIDILFVLIMTLPGVCVAIINASLVDIIPTHLCGMAVCICNTSGRLGSIISSSLAGIMLQWNCLVALLLYAFSLIVCLFVSLLFPKKPTK